MSPAFSAHKIEEHETNRILWSAKFDAAAIDVTQLCLPQVDSAPLDEADSPEAEIVDIFRRKLAGLRFMSRRERAQAVRAALEWLWFAMAALREKRAYARPTRRVRRRGGGPIHRPHT